MILNVAQICQAKYPDQVEKQNITFRFELSGVLIDTWNVEGIARPKEEDLLSEADKYKDVFNLNTFMNLGKLLIENTINETVRTRKYTNGIFCASYAQSTNPIWASEAKAFIAWRDAMYVYALKVYSDIQGGKPAPAQDEFIAGFPAIVWP